MKKVIILLAFLIAFAVNNTASAQKEYILLDSLLQACSDSMLTDSFFKIRDEAEAIAKALQDKETETKVSQYLVFRYYLFGETDSLRAATERTKILARENNFPFIYYNCWGLLLNNYNLTGLTERAISEAEAMGKEALAEGSSFGIATSYATSGDAYLYLGLYENAISFSNRAIEEMEKNDGEYNHNISNACYSIILAYSGLGEYQKILPYCEKMDSISTVEEKIDKGNLTNVSYRLVAQCGRIIAYSNMGQYQSAYLSYKKALQYYEICETQKDYLLEAEAVFFEKNGRYEEALESYKKLTEYYSQMGIVKEELRIIRAQADILAKSGKYKKACEYYSGYLVGTDSLNNNNSLHQLNEFSVLYDLQRAENESKNAELKMHQTRQNMITVISVCLLVSLIVSLSFIIRQHRTNSKLKVSEKYLTKAVEKAKESDRLKSAFLANMSHEIRTPLNSIVGFSQLISETDEPEEKEHYKEIIKVNSDQLLTLVNDVLDLSKIESGIVDLKREKFDLVPFMNQLFTTFDSIKRSDKVRLILDPHDDKCMVNIDKHRLNQLFTNFVTNALKFTKEGEIHIGYKADSYTLHIYVSDTGIGISEEERPKVFERFFKLNDFSQGNGLGLAISKAIVTASGGEIGVDSEVGVGSKFWARIPISE